MATIDKININGIVYNIGSSKPVYTGLPGTIGFGVGVCPAADKPTELTGMNGYDDPSSINFGNYIHTNTSVMCFVPKFYYRIGHLSAAQYFRYGLNTVEIVPANTFNNTAAANAAGWVLHRAFIDGGQEKSGFFYDKYMPSKASHDNTIAVSVKGGNPIAFATGAQNSSGMPGCTGIYADGIVLSKARGERYNAATTFMESAIGLISLAHAQASQSTEFNGWYDGANITNFPKGCNINALGDTNDTNLKWQAADGVKPRTGTCNLFEHSTHNGQACGIADVNGGLYRAVLGVTTASTSATDTAGNMDGLIYVLKESVRHRDLTHGWNTGNDAWGTATHLNKLYESTADYQFLAGNNSEWIKWGNDNNQVFNTEMSGIKRAMCGVLPKDANAISAAGKSEFGLDGIYRYSRRNIFVLSGGSWINAAYAGVFCRHLNTYRSASDMTVSFRVSAYPG